ncbi:expressed hypothetical protein [Trichoplax adhaerens]|uniref:TCTP domain-containing protein n=1 Tax=Trichoplax adhaerens TaxID=10228 RepID=B3RLY3_TRIAD|nr:expressed hypothetical protein [Trichoplax adhaerens]EDV29604.1 expressed hypothetical protein [Trichoplax adhaerens]|eukprot:XP_002108806.1 expressed hypothetical protein [Trichoplax adhaerens]
MIVFKDVFNDQEIFSDGIPYVLKDDLYYEIEGKMTSEVTDIPESAIGGNASAEVADETSEASSVSGINFVLANRLEKIDLTKKEFQSYIKVYMKKLLGYLEENSPDRVSVFKKGASAMVPKILNTFKDWDFYMGESKDSTCLLVLVNFREDGITPFGIVWKDGVNQEKY